MIKRFILTFYFLLTLSRLIAQHIDIDSITENNAYKPGEKLIYEVKYGMIKGGEASLTINVIPSGDDFFYYVKADAVTTGSVRTFAKIHDIYESYFSVTNGYPVKATRNIRENNYNYYNEIYFYRDRGFVYSVNSGKHKIPPNTLDLLSAFYFVRRHLFNHDFKHGQTIALTTFFDDDLYPVKIKFLKKEVIKTKFGKVKALRFVPVLTKDNPFKKEKDLQLWFSDDGNYIPLKIKMRTKVGSVKAHLIYYENLKNPLGLVK